MKKFISLLGLILLPISLSAQYINTVVPNSGPVGTWSLPVTISGSNTNFSSATSTVVRIYNGPLELEVLNVSNVTSNTIDFELRIPYTALTGYYDVQVYDQNVGVITHIDGFIVTPGNNLPYIIETSPDSVRQNKILPVTISTANTYFSQATDNTIYLTQGTNTILPIPGSITAISDTEIEATFDFNVPFLDVDSVLNSHCGNSFDGILSDYLSIIIIDSTLSIKSIIADSKIKAYPNPTNGQIKVELPKDLTNFEVTIFNQMGQAILTQSITGNKSYFFATDVSYLADGIYVIKFESKEASHFVKIIKK